MWNLLKSAARRLWVKRDPHPWQEIRVGRYTLHLQPTNKHEIAYLEKYNKGIRDVDVAIARCLLKKGDVALDLGANIGYVSLHLLASGAKEVHAFEPHPLLFSRLRNIRAKALFCYPYAISDKAGIRDLILSVTHNQGSTLQREVVQIRPRVFGDNPSTVQVETHTIDEIFPNKAFDYIKVDIEGSELDFVRGAHRLLSSRPPRVLVIEIKPEFKERYLNVLGQYFLYAKRVDYNKWNGDICLCNVDASSSGDYKNEPPNYVFAIDPTVLE